MPSLIQLRRGSSSEWTHANPILASGEAGVVTDFVPVKVKIGDGVSPWIMLPYLDSSAIKILAIADPLVFDPLTGILSVNVNEIVDGSNY